MKDIRTLYTTSIPNPNNTSVEEIQALSELKQKKDIAIKPADKGGKIVIWPVEQYLQEAHGQLSDTNYYKEQQSDDTVETAYEVYAIF